MPRIVVDVMPKPEILDPQGKAIAGALPRLGFTGFAEVRQGKRFELSVEGDVTEEVLQAARDARRELDALFEADAGEGPVAQAVAPRRD